MRKHWTKWLSAAGACALGGSLQAATNTVDFNSDPALTGVYTEQPGRLSGEWRPNGGATGAAGDGYLALNDAKGGQSAGILFKDLENGLIIKSFVFECDLRIGGGTDNPADGFSLNYAATDDPVLTGGNYAGTDGETNLPEEGTQTGLAIGFDTWQSGTINGVQDVVGLSIRVGGRLIAQLPVPLAGTNIYFPTAPIPGAQGTNYTYDPVPYRNLATNNANFRFSMQTGARADVNGDGSVNTGDDIAQPAFDDPRWSLWITNLSWQHFKASVDDQGKVQVFWKGNEITPPGGLASGFTPIAGRLVFAARTGGSWEAQHVDNIRLVTQPFTSAVVQSVNGNASGVNITILDQSTATLDTNTLVIKVNGATITPAAVTHSGLVTTIRHNASPLLAVGTNTVQITFRDNLGVATDVTRQVIVGPYLTADPSLVVPTGSVNTNIPGFTVRTHQLPIGRGPGDGNRWAMAERHLGGGFIDPGTGLPFDSIATPGTNTDGTFTLQVINWDQGSPARAGNFTDQATGTQAVADGPIPGVAPGDPNNIVAEVVTYLQIPAGFYTLGVNSDDGFRVNFSNGLHGIFGQQLGLFDGGKGSSDVLFDVNVPAGGTFPVRLLWWEGGGGANCEFFYIDNVTGNKILVNDLAHGSVIKAYTTATTGRRPAVTRVTPEITQQFVPPDADVAAWVVDGDVTVSSVTLTVNGTNVTAAPVKTGNTTVIKRVGGPTSLLPAYNNTATLVYSYTDGGVPVSKTNTWTFRVLGYGVIPTAFKLSPADVAGAQSPGIRAFVRQIQRRLGNTTEGDDNGIFPGDQNRMPRPEYLLKGGYFDAATGTEYPNVAVTNPGDSSFFYDLFELNYNSGFNGTAPNRTISSPDSGIFTPEFGSVPGTGAVGAPERANFANGGEDNIVAEFTTYLDLKAGATILAVNSDDGFVASSGADPRDTAGVRLGFFTGGRGNSNPLPQPTNDETPTPGVSNGNSAFAAVVLEDGIYPIRVLYWQGGGGVNVEFLSVSKQSGQQALVGDTSSPFGIPSYETAPLALPKAWAIYPPSPTPWDNRIQQEKVGLPKFYGNSPNSVNSDYLYNDTDDRRPFADSEIGAVFANATGKTITLKVNGATVTPAFTPSGTNTIVAYKPNPPLPSGSTNTATLSYEGGSYSWTWRAPVYTNAPSGAALPLSQATGASSGFSIKVAQGAAGRANTVLAAEQQLAGSPTNAAGTNSARADGRFIAPYINYNNDLNVGGPATVTQIGNFQTNALTGWPFPKIADQPFPGLATNLTTSNSMSVNPEFPWRTRVRGGTADEVGKARSGQGI